MPDSDKTYVLSVAGYDPCGGAGVLADIKTFEQLGVYGMSACTAITYQTEDVFSGLKWLEWNEIASQLLLLISRYQFKVAKIGLIQDERMLAKIIATLKAEIPLIRIVWDPILKASAGYPFFQEWDQSELEDILKQITIITPNWDEAIHLSRYANGLAGAKHLALYTNVFLKGGHNKSDIGVDYLVKPTGEIVKLTPKSNDVSSKHGSGCVLSASLSAFLAKGFDLEKSCRFAKDYTYNYMQSSPQLLGSHLSWDKRQ